MSLEELSQEELKAKRPTTQQILELKTEAFDPQTHKKILVPDVLKQVEALRLQDEIDLRLNQLAVEAQNEEAENKVIWARPVAAAEGNDYDAYMHKSCGSPDDWDELLVNEAIKNTKCIGCGGTLSGNN